MSDTVPRTTFETMAACMERSNRRLWIALLVCVVLLSASWAWFIWYENQFVDEVTETVTTSTDNGGNAYGTIISGDNSEVRYGESGNN